MVSVTIGHGTSLMAPSNIRNTMTRPERTRPVQRASLEVGRVSAMTVMIDPRCLEWLFEFKTNEGSGGRQGGVRNFSTAPLLSFMFATARPTPARFRSAEPPMFDYPK